MPEVGTTSLTWSSGSGSGSGAGSGAPSPGVQAVRDAIEAQPTSVGHQTI